MTRFLLPLYLLLAGLVGASSASAGEPTEIFAGARYPEGPLWHGGKLYFAEMTRDRIAVWDGARTVSFWRQRGCGMTSIAPAPGGHFLVTCHIGGGVVWLSRRGRMRAFTTQDNEGRRLGNPNASTSDRNGGVYFSSSGDFDLNAPATGAIYYARPDAAPRRVADRIRYANGVAVGPKRAYLYVSAHLGRHILRYRIGPDGGLSAHTVWYRLPARRARDDILAGPDGLAFDAAGNLYAAEYGAGRILVIGADAKLANIIKIPARFVTSQAFGPDGRTLYVTAPASRTVWPYAGAVYRIADPLK